MYVSDELIFIGKRRREEESAKREKPIFVYIINSTHIIATTIHITISCV